MDRLRASATVASHISKALKLRELQQNSVAVKAKLSSRGQVGCYRSLQESQGSLAVPVVRQPSRRPLAPLGFLEAALAADLITA